MVDSIKSINHVSKTNKAPIESLREKNLADEPNSTNQMENIQDRNVLPVDRKSVESETDKLNKMIEAADIQDLRFKLHEESGQLYAQVINGRNEVIKTFPPEHLLELSAKMKDLVGMFIDQKI